MVLVPVVFVGSLLITHGFCLFNIFCKFSSCVFMYHLLPPSCMMFKKQILDIVRNNLVGDELPLSYLAVLDVVANKIG